ncbi:MAG: ATP-binding protein [Nanoarchaeota archaeon]
MVFDIGSFLNRPEDEFLEFKQSFNHNELAQTIAAMSTSNGGIILVGIDNKGVPLGINCNEDEIRKKVFDIENNLNDNSIKVELNFTNHSPQSKIIAIKVKEGYMKPYGWNGIYYKRSGSSNSKMSSDEIAETRLKSKSLSFDNLTAQLYNREAVINDLEENKIKSYIEAYNTSRRNKKITYNNMKDFLTTFNLISNGNQVKNSAILLFGKEPNDCFQNSKINLLIYSGDTEGENNLKSKRIISGEIGNQIRESVEIIRLSTENKVFMEGLQRIEVNQYPLDAIREAVTNAVAHRDYSAYDSFITIRLFDNYLEIINPGGLLEGLEIEKIKEGGLSKRRNPSISSMLDNLGLMEQSGQGIKKMLNAMMKMGLREPQFFSDKNFFKVRFFGQNISTGENSQIIGKSLDLSEHLSPLQKKGLEHVTKRGEKNITIKEYMSIINSNSRLTATNHLNKFVDLGLLKPRKLGKKIVFERVF